MLDLARVIAKRSTCARRNVGAVLTDTYGRVLAIAHNGNLSNGRMFPIVEAFGKKRDALRIA